MIAVCVVALGRVRHRTAQSFFVAVEIKDILGERVMLAVGESDGIPFSGTHLLRGSRSIRGGIRVADCRYFLTFLRLHLAGALQLQLAGAFAA